MYASGDPGDKDGSEAALKTGEILAFSKNRLNRDDVLGTTNVVKAVRTMH